MKKILLGFILGCILTFGISINAAEISSQFVKIYDTITGGKVEVRDKDNNVNVRMGSESGTADNVGGTLVLYNDSENKPRTELGINKRTDSGIINLKDGNNITRVQIEAIRSLGKAYITLYDETAFPRTWLSETEGYIDYEKIITEDYLKANYYSKDEVEKMIEEALKKYKN
jgi:hypothetical protein